MNNSIKRYAVLFCVLLLIISVFTACKSTPQNNGSTEDPFSVTEYPATVAPTQPQNTSTSTTAPAYTTGSTTSSSGSTASTTKMFDDFATTTTPAATEQRHTTEYSYHYTEPTTPYLPTVPSVPETTTKATTKPIIDPELTNTTNGGSRVDIVKLLTAFGYAYDPDEDCFYSEVDSWQRNGGFAPHYDLGAFALNMHYLTFRVDFDWGGESWRLQFWKGNYSVVLDGAEIGVYTKPLGSGSELYSSADDDHLLNMSMDLYKKNPRTAGNKYFSRPAVDHWWLTGFKIVQSNAVPGKMVMVCTIRFRDSEMAESFTESLETVRGEYAPLKHFRAVDKMDLLTDDTYLRKGNKVTMCWRGVGWLNYDFPSETTTEAP